MRLIPHIIKLFPESFRDRYRGEWCTLKSDVKTGKIWGKLKRMLIAPPIPKLNNGVTYVHLGCGYVNQPKFINVDLVLAPHIHYRRPVDKLSFFKDMSVDLIYASHCLEHFSHQRICRILKEWFRILKNDGILRLSVPDFDLLIGIYRLNNNDINKILPPLFGGQEYALNFHKTAFTRSSLEALLKNAGFKAVRNWKHDSSALTKFNDSSTAVHIFKDKEYPISLNLEAVKSLS